jgi:molecular chaperone GrpE
MYEVPQADVPPGHVAQVIQAGYMIGERVLRPALVGVAKAAPKTGQAQPEALNDNPQTGGAA